MKYGIIADIHGNLTAFKAVLEELEKEHIDKYILVGDYIYDGPSSNEVIELIKTLDCICVKGNKEDYLFNIGDEYREYKQFEQLYYTRDLMTKENIEYISKMKDEMILKDGNTRIKITHKPSYSYIEGRINCIADSDKILAHSNYDVEIYAHTHDQEYFSNQSTQIFNPGSVGLPLDGRVNAQYALMNVNGDEVSIELKECSYNIDETIYKFKERGFLNNCLIWTKTVIGCLLTGDNHSVYFLEKAHQLMDNPNKLIPNDIWIKNDQVYDWPDIINKYIQGEDNGI